MGEMKTWQMQLLWVVGVIALFNVGLTFATMPYEFRGGIKRAVIKCNVIGDGMEFRYNDIDQRIRALTARAADIEVRINDNLALVSSLMTKSMIEKVLYD